jgi:S-adenosylmethionine-diacylglycerol 3-amino-3-carboxypropyl transferase
LIRTFLHPLQDRFFRYVHGNRLVYNTCWEDPRLDRQLLDIGADSRVVVITSAGDNALEYLLDNPASVDCVDVNYRQNALLELKRAVIGLADHATLYSFFGRGGGHECAERYRSLRTDLPSFAAGFWDRSIEYFKPSGSRRSFYYRGTSGCMAWLFGRVLGAVKPGVRGRLLRLLEVESLEEQRRLYGELEPVFWDRLSQWIVGRHATMAMLGVPRPQVALISQSHPGGLAGYVKDKIRRVFTELPMSENYFWRVYITGRYTASCCPEYLNPANFRPLTERLPRLRSHTDTLSGFLRRNPGPYTHFVLLDHQDWLAGHAPDDLREEWELILAAAAPGAKILLRTAGLDVSFIPRDILERLRFHDSVTTPLHRQDRVGTYGSLHLADVP